MEGYKARLQLAALDHNFHLTRDQATTKAGDKRSHRTYRKRTKQWDVVPIRSAKQYVYMPELQMKMLEFRAKGIQVVRPPTCLPPTIAHEDPPSTQDIILAKKSTCSE